MPDDETRAEATGWFDRLYAAASRDAGGVPWAALEPCSEVVAFLDRHPGKGRAIVVGCGLGDDAAAVGAAGWDTTAFDVAPEAIAWARERFGDLVEWHVADLFNLPEDWRGGFDLVVEVRTVQSLPLVVRSEILDSVASLVAPGGRLLLVCEGRSDRSIPTGPPWPVSDAELAELDELGMERVSFERHHHGPMSRVVAEWIRPA